VSERSQRRYHSDSEYRRHVIATARINWLSKNWHSIKEPSEMSGLTNAEKCKLFYEKFKEERKRRQRELYFRMKAKALDLFSRKCQDCKWNDAPEALEFDHIVPIRSKRRSVWDVLKNPKAFRLLCPNCHKRRTMASQMTFANTPANRHRRRKRLEALNLLGGACVSCGNTETVVLEIDHREPVLTGSHRRTMSGSESPYQELKSVFLEPEKFQILCATCHELKTKKETHLWHRSKE
jgi:5-methylcytosine-specific restriction endonuclease McrA